MFGETLWMVNLVPSRTQEMMAKIRLYPDPMYCSDAQQPLKKAKLMDPDEALRTMEMEVRYSFRSRRGGSLTERVVQSLSTTSSFRSRLISNTT